MSPHVFKSGSGQALTEFLVICLVLVPLFLLVPMIAKYQDIVFASHLASRYVAFDAMYRNAAQAGWKSEAELKQEAARRFFSNPDAPIKTGDTAGNFDAHRNQLWRDPTGNPLIRDFNDDVLATFGLDYSKTRNNNAFSPGSNGQPFNPGFLPVAKTMGLVAPGIYSAGIELRLANLPADIRSLRLFDTINLVVRNHTSLIVDGWTARGPAEVNERINHELIFPAKARPGPSWDILEASVVTVELGNVDKPSFAKLPLWEDIVPADRLKNKQP